MKYILILILLQNNTIFLSWLAQMKNWLEDRGLPIGQINNLMILIKVLFILLLAYLTYFLARKLLRWLIPLYIRKTKFKWNDILLKHKVFRAFAYFIPIIIFYNTAYWFENELVIKIIQKVVIIISTIIFLHFFTTLLNVFNEIYTSSYNKKRRYIKNYIQIFKVILYSVVILFLVSYLLGMTINNLWKILVSFSAFATLLFIIYKDAILGFISGIQLSANNMVRIGDWVSIPKLQADGTIIDISLTMVKIQNWDKSITSIPIYSMISDSFINWSGMQEAGIRRIKRHFHIDINSIRFLQPNELEKYNQISFLSSYVKDIKTNENFSLENIFPKDKTKLTNASIFRFYIKMFLKHHPDISKKNAILVRQLQPTANGLPLEIYTFTNTSIWEDYEAILSDITDFILAIAKEFDIKIFQNPTGKDFQNSLYN